MENLLLYIFLKIILSFNIKFLPLVSLLEINSLLLKNFMAQRD